MLQVFGQIGNPAPLSNFQTVQAGGVGQLVQLLLDILIVGASLYALFNFALAGYGFLSAADDPKKIAGAWAKIWQTALGLVVVAGSFILAAIFGKLIFGDYSAILQPSIPGI